ncbi:DUF1801 domain-containing protein [Hahella ganghwensis]|uniref:DUF1801 domain-containing protein n=1 Tax=Hahella ganghwensis TaxID=286420 RepID=UPI00036C396A|nr:DUF1801 domain-containing protein [Hahella ganghwensis]
MTIPIDAPEVLRKYEAYPNEVRPGMLSLRSLIFESARDLDITDLQETLKWGEPSYLCHGGSTVRIDWKPATPNVYGIYFHCQTSLVQTFKELYGNLFQYQGKRAILLDMASPIPSQQIRHCIGLSLQYHKVKHLPLLGAVPAC